MSNYALRIPDSLFDYVRQCAEEENVSMNQFFVMAIAEKVSALKTAEYFQHAAERADVKSARNVLRKVADRPPEIGDEISAEVKEPRPTYRVLRKSAAKTAVKNRKREPG